MSISITNVGKVQDAIIVEFSDGSFSAFTARELLSVKRFRSISDELVPPVRPN